MAEAKKNYSNIETIGSLLGAEGIGSLLREVQGTEKKVGDILRKLSDLEAAARARAQEEAARAEAEPAAAQPAPAAEPSAEPAQAPAAVQAEPARQEEPAPAEQLNQDCEQKHR